MSAVPTVSNSEATATQGVTARWASTRLDWWLVGCVITLLGLGVLMIYSASSLEADSRYGDPLHYVYRQVAGVGLGLGAIVAALLVPWRWVRRSGLWLYLGALVGLVLVFTPIGYRAYEADRWISLGGVNAQPSEFAKIALILVLSGYLASNEGRLRDLMGTVVPALAIPVPMIVLLMLEPDFGTTVITCALVGVMLFIAGLQWRWILAIGSMAVTSLGAGALLAPYRVARLTSFLDPFSDPERTGYQVIQAWIAMAAGGWTGQGIAAGVAQRGALPEAHNDMISAVLAEELGGVGWIVLVALYALLIWRGTWAARNARDLFGTLVATTLTTLLASQALINLGVVVGLLPAKGLVLPFVSYGSSAVLAHLICVGLLLRIGAEGVRARAQGGS